MSNAKCITTILFDCDNTLVLSEELAFEGCADLINEICTTKGLEISPFSGETLITEFVGQNFRGMIKSIQDRHGLELTPYELEDYVRREEDVVIAKLRQSLRPCEGVEEQLRALESEGGRTLAVVSSSALRRVKASVDKVGFDGYFGGRIYSAASSLDPPTSKPDPAIYLHSMAALGASNPKSCLAVEDSRSGSLSASRAGIPTIGYVGPYADDKRGEMEAALREAGAGWIMRHWDEFPDLLRRVEEERAT